MEAAFWQERWQRGQTGWHQAAVNPTLVERWHELPLAAGDAVFVPLCGKSVDMVWLAARGHRVIGSELSEIAVRDFFAEHDLSPAVRTVGALTVFEAGPYELWCGDFFDLPADALVGVTAVYDRASLVALPPDTRRAYAEHMATVIPIGAISMLLTFVYDQSEMDGPPFSVPGDEVRGLFGDAFETELHGVLDILDRNPDLGARGVTGIDEHLHLLRRSG